jgi:hypothetical protein
MGERLGDPQHVSAISRPSGQRFTFTEASAYVLTIGKYKGKTLDEIATTDDGLVYLDWLLGAREYANEASGRRGSANERETTEYLRTYLTDQTIAREVIAARKK